MNKNLILNYNLWAENSEVVEEIHEEVEEETEEEELQEAEEPQEVEEVVVKEELQKPLYSCYNKQQGDVSIVKNAQFNNVKIKVSMSKIATYKNLRKQQILYFLLRDIKFVGTIVPHPRLAGVFVAKGQQEALVTKNMVPGESVYNEKRISVEDKQTGEKVEYRVWNPFRSKIAAGVIGGVSDIFIKPGAKVLYLGAASGTTVSHVSDIVGSEGMPLKIIQGVVYAVEFSHRSGRDLVNMAKKRTNIVPIIADARKPLEYRMLVGMVDVVFADVAQPDQARIVGLNSQYFLKKGGHFMISIKANCIDSTNRAEVVFQHEVQRLKDEGLTPQEQLTLEPYERDHAIVIGVYNA